jgi:ketosteroid isomerase-like protein
MASNVDNMKERYQQFDQGDVEGALSNWSDDFEWDGGEENGLPGSGIHKGKDEAVKVLQEAVGSWDSFKLVPDEYIDGGDTVVVLGHTEVSKDGNTEELPVVHIWRYEGDQVKRLTIATDTLKSAKLLGKA